MATVYRNLNQMAELGIIKKISGLHESSHFDHKTHQHHHFTCKKCHKIYDIPHDIIPDIKDTIFTKTGMIVDECEILLRGICNDCQTKN